MNEIEIKLEAGCRSEFYRIPRRNRRMFSIDAIIGISANGKTFLIYFVEQEQINEHLSMLAERAKLKLENVHFGQSVGLYLASYKVYSAFNTSWHIVRPLVTFKLTD